MKNCMTDVTIGIWIAAFLCQICLWGVIDILQMQANGGRKKPKASMGVRMPNFQLIKMTTFQKHLIASELPFSTTTMKHFVWIMHFICCMHKLALREWFLIVMVFVFLFSGWHHFSHLLSHIFYVLRCQKISKIFIQMELLYIFPKISQITDISWIAMHQLLIEHILKSVLIFLSWLHHLQHYPTHLTKFHAWWLGNYRLHFVIYNHFPLWMQKWRTFILHCYQWNKYFMCDCKFNYRNQKHAASIFHVTCFDFTNFWWKRILLLNLHKFTCKLNWDDKLCKIKMLQKY